MFEHILLLTPFYSHALWIFDDFIRDKADRCAEVPHEAEIRPTT